MEPNAGGSRQALVDRWLEYEGELRAALVRVALVACGYAAQLLHFIVFAERSEAVVLFHRQATYVAAAWLFVSLAVLVALTRRWLPSWLKYATQLVDIALLTLVASLGAGPHSPVVSFYFVLVVLAALRGNLTLIWFGTCAAMVGYLILVALEDPTWFNEQHETPPIEQIMMHLSLGATGIIVGQLARMMRHVFETFDEPADAATCDIADNGISKPAVTNTEHAS